MKKSFAILPAICCAIATTGAAAELNPLFQNDAVLQCDTRVPIWGTGRDGETITVAFGGQKVSTVVSNGAWKVWLAPMKPNSKPLPASPFRTDSE